MDQNVVILSFAEESKTYQALSELKALAAEQRVQLVNAAVVQRDGSGQLRIKDGASDGATATGPVTGTLVGALVDRPERSTLGGHDNPCTGSTHLLQRRLRICRGLVG